MNSAASIVWFRLDLRLADNPALTAAVHAGGLVIPVFIYAPDEEAPWAPGGASRWWLHQSLKSLQASLQKIGSNLIIRVGPTLETLLSLVQETGATSVYWNRRYEPVAIARDKRIEEALRREGLEVACSNAALLHDAGTVLNQSGRPFQVFTAFWKSCLKKPDPPNPLPAPQTLPPPTRWPKSLRLEALELEPKINWAQGLRDAWQPGETGAVKQLRQFLASAFDDYSVQRNRPDVHGTSRLSPHLHFGEISPRQIWAGIQQLAVKRNLPVKLWRESQYLSEIGWREFAHHMLFHFPATTDAPLRGKFASFPWRKDARALRAWEKGATGFPMIDAGMRELWATGWMHNRVRMLVASFLTKDLLIAWQQGARWFWDTLVDADLAQNTLGWQWTAGCGADAAPYFRVFNPTTQGQKFDPHGIYIRRWCPELAQLPDQWIHEPHAAPESVLAQAGIKLGRDYPRPIVSHNNARTLALQSFAELKND